MISSAAWCFITFLLSETTAQEYCEYFSGHLPTPIAGQAGAYSSVSRSVYLFGGYATDQQTANRQIYEFVMNGSASSSPTSPFLDIGVSATDIAPWVQVVAEIEGILYLVGVWESPFTIIRYDTTNRQWLAANVAEPPIALTGGCVANNGSHIFMVDGQDSTELNVVHIQAYDIARDAWTAYQVNVTAWSTYTGGGYVSWMYQYCYYVRDSLYLFGGVVGDNYYLSGVWKYAIGELQLTPIATLPEASAYGMAVYDGYDHVYLVGGWSRGIGYTNQIRIFDINTERLSDQVMFAQQPFCCSVAVVMDAKLWIFGGEVQGGDVTDTVQICDLSSFVPTSDGADLTTTVATVSEGGSLPPSRTSDDSEGANNEDVEQQQQKLLIYATIAFAAAVCCCVAALVFYLRTVRASSRQKKAVVAVAPASKRQVAASPSELPSMEGIEMYAYPLQPQYPAPYTHAAMFDGARDDEKADALPQRPTQELQALELSNVVLSEEEEDDQAVLTGIEMNMVNGPSTRA